MPERVERPSEDVVKAADEALRGLRSEDTPVFLQIREKKLQLHPHIANLMIEVFEQLSEGKPVSILPHNAEMTTRQAGLVLGVSLEEVIRYKQEQAVRRRDALARMTEIAEELGLPD